MILTPFLTEKQAYTHPECIIDNSWDYIKDLLLQYQDANTKEEIQMFNLWSMKTVNFEEPTNKETGEIYKPGYIARCTNNCIGLWGLVLDYDKNLTIIEAIDLFDGWEYILYTTWNHRRINGKNVKRGDRFRIVMPFTRMMTMEEYNQKLDSIKSTFPGVDNASFTRSQAMFHHSGIKEEKLSFHCKGTFIDPDMFLNSPKAKPVVTTNHSRMIEITDRQKTQWCALVIEALSLCSNIRRADGMVLASIVKGCGGTFEDFKSICELMVDSSLSDKKAYNGLWKDAKEGVHVSKDTINKYLQNWGGKIIPQRLTSPVLVIKNTNKF